MLDLQQTTKLLPLPDTLFYPAAACCITAIPTVVRHHDDLWRLAPYPAVP